MASAQRTGTLDQHPGGVTSLTATITDATDHITTLITATGATDFVDVRPFRQVTIGVVNGASNVCTYTVEGSPDGTNFETIAYGSGSSAAYTQAAKTTTAGDDDMLFLPPDDYVGYVRVNISAANANGCTFNVFGRS